MSKQNLSAEHLFDRIPMTASQRIRAEANMRRGEYMADLMLRLFRAIAAAARSLRSHAKAKPAQRLGPAS
jgi:hypothetical protein